MVRLYDGQITDIIPEVLRSENEVKALSIALLRQTRKICDLAAKELIYPAIDTLEDDVLDFLAVELQTQHYDQSYTTDRKRELIKGTLLWYVKAGTKWAVEDLAQTVFGQGTRVIEYKDSTDVEMKPYEFDIKVPSSVESKTVEEFTDTVFDAKNARSHLRSVRRYQMMGGTMHIGIAGTLRKTIKTDIRYTHRDGYLSVLIFGAPVHKHITTTIKGVDA